MRTVLFDLDRTLLAVNSAHLWFWREFRQGRITKTELLKLIWWLVVYELGGAADDTKAFERAAEAIKGTSEIELRERVYGWFEREVKHQIRPGAVSALDRHRDSGDYLVIATSGSSYSAEIACETFGLDDWIATTFAVDAKGQFTGKINELAYGNAKAKAAEKWAERKQVPLSDCWFYTDSMTDLHLMEKVGTAIAVNPDRRLRVLARKRNWAIEDWGKPR